MANRGIGCTSSRSEFESACSFRPIEEGALETRYIDCFTFHNLFSHCVCFYYLVIAHLHTSSCLTYTQLQCRLLA
jgi:hypothetical protein